MMTVEHGHGEHRRTTDARSPAPPRRFVRSSPARAGRSPSSRWARLPAPVETLLNEPRPPGATGPQRRDWVLVGAIASLSLVEGVSSDALTSPPLAVGLCIGLALTLPWRRVRPLAAVLIAFGTTAAVQSVALVSGVEWYGADASLFLLILPYALLRRGSGREALAGLAAITITFATAVPATNGWAEGIGAGFFLFFPAALGASVRYRDSARRRAVEQVRLREREELARELHDTVAHHVSAIAVRAQAGRVLADTHRDAPLEALGIIEDAASRALAEMRHIVRALREDDERENAVPAGGTLADVTRLIEQDASPLGIELAIEGDLDDLDAALGTTLYRLVREALTNAARHARGAGSVSVRIAGEPGHVHLAVVDDGETVTRDEGAGFGLRGMAERVALLGGTFRAGSVEPRGWRVEATLPKRTNDP